jgi:hypothetical protein
VGWLHVVSKVASVQALINSAILFISLAFVSSRDIAASSVAGNEAAMLLHSNRLL